MNEAAFNPMLGIASWQTKHGGAWRLWVLVRTLDKSGCGYIPTEELKAAISALKVNKRTFATWLQDAKEFGLLLQPSGGVRTAYVSESRAAEILLCVRMDARKAVVSVKRLFAKGWKSVVWAAYIKANHDGKVISRAKLEALTGVPCRQQRHIDSLVKRKRNIAISNQPADKLNAIREFGNKAAPFVYNMGNGKRVVAWHLPARVKVSDRIAKPGNFGRNRKVRSGMCDCGLFLVQQPLSERQTLKLFHETKDEKGKAIRLSQSIRNPADPHEVYALRGHRCAVGVWDVLPLQDY